MKKGLKTTLRGVFFCVKTRKYSAEIKIAAVKSYLAGEWSLRAVCTNYEITDKILLRQWIKWYNGLWEFKERASAKGEIYITNGRKTTQEERTKIVAFCVEHNYDYGLTIETYKV